MAREILFKAKRKDTGEWIEGLVACPHFTDTEKGVESYYFYELKQGGSYQRIVSADSICQFTGLYDSTKWEDLTAEEKQRFYEENRSEDGITIKYKTIEDVKHLWKGKKIWENDVVFVTDDEGQSGQVDTGVGEIEFIEGLWYIGGSVQNSLYDINNCFLIEVIDNIFDNPELLGGADNV